MKHIVVPVMIAISGAFMAFAWLGHLRIKHYGFWVALGLSWMVVLPEYVLNVFATRYGHGMFTGAQMAAMHLASGVVFVLLVSRYVLGEPFSLRQGLGFALLLFGSVLILGGRN